MDQLFKLKDTFIGYLSPAKRRRTITASTPSGKQPFMQRPIQPTTEPRNRKEKTRVAGRVSKKYLSPSDTRRSVRRSRETKNSDDKYEESKDDFESATQETHSDLTPEDSTSQIRSRSDDDTVITAPAEGDVESDEDLSLSVDGESELDAEAKVHQFLDRQSELARRQETLNRIKEEDWHEDEVALFEKLSMRGFEPLLPAHWSFDFRTCPKTIFSSNDEETFINSQSGNDFRATTALLSLITLGGRVRGLLESHKPQEQLIKKELENYIKWSERDGGYASKRFFPLLTLVAGRPNQELPEISKAITDQLEFLAVQHRQALALPTPGRLDELSKVEMFSRRLPVLYGVIIAHYIIVFVTLDSAKLDAKVKTIAHFDFSDKDMDVWNGFAVAILVCMVRNHLMARRDEMESETEEENDPDL